MDFTMSTSAPIHFVVLRDDYSGLTWIKPVANQTAHTFCDLLASWLTAYPCPAYLATDSGPAFRSTVTKLLRQTYKLDAIHHSPMNHKANGSVEVVIRIARQTLAALRSEHRHPPDKWHLLAPLLQLCINSAPQPSRAGFSAIELAFGQRQEDVFEARLSEAGISAADFTKERFLAPGERLRPFASHVRRLLDSLDRLHRQVDDHLAARQARSKSLYVASRDFAPGCFVLYSKPLEARTRHPLRYFASK